MDVEFNIFQCLKIIPVVFMIKCHKSMTFDHVLDLELFTFFKGESLYNLYAVIVENSVCHYIAYIEISGIWFEIDGGFVSKVQPDKVRASPPRSYSHSYR